MDCPYCGAELAEGARFCVGCGAALDGTRAMPVAEPAVSPAPAGSPAPNKKSKKGVVIAIVCAAVLVVGGGGGLAYHLYQQHVQEQEQYESAHSKHALVVSVKAEGWDTDDGASRVPVRVKGKTVDGKKVDKVEYVASDGSGIKLIQGKYTLKAAGSPIAADGTIYQVPCTKAELTLDDAFAKGEKIDLAKLAEQDSVLDFTPIDAADVTDDEINDAVTLAMAYKGKDAPNVDALQHAATNRRDTAVAAKKAAEEEAARQAEEQRKAAARHIEAQTFSVDLPEYWDGRVTVEVDGDTITVRSKLYPSKVVVALIGSSNPDRNMGDVAGGAITIVPLSDNFFVRLGRTRWSYVAAEEAHSKKYLGKSYSSDSVSEQEATELTDLQSLGTVSYSKILSDFLASEDGHYSDELAQQDKAMQDALTPSLKLL